MLTIKQPYNFPLSVSVVESFASEHRSDASFLKVATRINNTPTVLDIRQDGAESADLSVWSSPSVDPQAAQKTAEWILFADLDLLPFYRVVENDEHLGPIVRQLSGIKPMRPASLFEMAVIAITEQQISLAAAYRIRQRMVERYGDAVDGLWVFPETEILANASVDDLRACGLTYRKAEYITGLAQRVINGSIDFERLVQLGDDEAREILLGIRGFGRWSADYVLVRGLARPDCVPLDDVAIQHVAAKTFGNGRRFSAVDLEEALKPYAPYSGLAVYYLLADEKLSHQNPGMMDPSHLA